MKLLFVARLDEYSRSTYTIVKYVQAAQALGHDVAVFGETDGTLPEVPFSLDVHKFHFAIFIIRDPSDLPELPYLATLLDGIPRDRRVIIDLLGRYNPTIREEHDFNHLEKLDGHQGWEWLETFDAISERILQPCLIPLKENVHPFLFFAFEPNDVDRPYQTSTQAVRNWRESRDERPYGLMYVGHNWQRWTQLRPILEASGTLFDEVGQTCLIGWDWRRPPDWATAIGLQGATTDEKLLRTQRVEVHGPIRFSEVSQAYTKSQFSLVLIRPLYRHLGLVSNRVFESFVTDTLPLLGLPRSMILDIYGAAAERLILADEVREQLRDAISNPGPYWEAVLAVREHLSKHHSFVCRLKQLVGLLST